MKLGLIADIHADYDTLTSVLATLQTVHQVDRLLCAGDLVGYGSQANAVVALFRESDIPTVKGNHDSPSADITSKNAEYLRHLPFDLRTEVAGYSIYLCHGIPQTNVMGFTERMLAYDSARDSVLGLGVDFVLAGHTHQVFCQHVGQTWILNPGALYAQSDTGTSQSYGILDFDRLVFTIWDSVRHELKTEFLLESL